MLVFYIVLMLTKATFLTAFEQIGCRVRVVTLLKVHEDVRYTLSSNKLIIDQKVRHTYKHQLVDLPLYVTYIQH